MLDDCVRIPFSIPSQGGIGLDVRESIHRLWPDWTVLEAIGRGAYGVVYRARRQDIAGPSYAAISRRLPSQAPCRVFGYGNSGSGDYVQIECYDEGLRQYRRAWVPVSAVTGLHFY